jgi:hypothetical protein
MLLEILLSRYINNYYYNIYKQKWKEKLQIFNIPLYKQNTGFGQAMIYLLYNLNNNCKIEYIKKFVKKNGVKLCGSDSLQLRHVARYYNLLKGYENNPNTNIQVPKSHFCLLDLDKHHPSYIPDRNTSILLTEKEWKTMKKDYEYKCATCGNKEGDILRYNKYKITKLHKGHMNPLKVGNTKNIIPQCEDCNKQYKNKAIFNKQGRVINFNKNGFI